MIKEINPKETKIAEAFELWNNAPNPMVTVFKTIDVTKLLKFSRKNKMKFNMIMCYCIGKAASGMEEFYLLSIGSKLMQYDSLVVNQSQKIRMARSARAI